jgi:hypothetical protein
MVMSGKFCLLKYDTAKSGESQKTYWRNIAPSASGPKSKPGKKSSSKHQTVWYYITESRTLQLLVDSHIQQGINSALYCTTYV